MSKHHKRLPSVSFEPWRGGELFEDELDEYYEDFKPNIPRWTPPWQCVQTVTRAVTAAINNMMEN